MVTSPAYQLLVARDSEGICATLTFVAYRAPGGAKARIDDVVADQTRDGQAAAAALVREAIRCAAVAGASEIKLVSKPALIARTARTNSLVLRKTDQSSSGGR